jgi:hypothetical protein
MGIHASPGRGIGRRSLTLTSDLGVEIGVIAGDGKATRDDRVRFAGELRDPGGERAGERVAENEESAEPDCLQDRDQIFGQIPDTVGALRVQAAALGEPVWARGDHGETLGERAEIEVIRPGEVQVGQQQRRARPTTHVVAQFQAVTDKRRHRARESTVE